MAVSNFWKSRNFQKTGISARSQKQGNRCWHFPGSQMQHYKILACVYDSGETHLTAHLLLLLLAYFFSWSKSIMVFRWSARWKKPCTKWCKLQLCHQSLDQLPASGPNDVNELDTYTDMDWYIWQARDYKTCWTSWQPFTTHSSIWAFTNMSHVATMCVSWYTSFQYWAAL